MHACPAVPFLLHVGPGLGYFWAENMALLSYKTPRDGQSGFALQPDVIPGVWETWITRLYNLRRDKRGNHERPHKPVLLLSILDLIDRGEICGNRVSLSAELIATFKKYFEVVRKADDQPKIEHPFYHLSGDGFWRLEPKPGHAPIYTKGEAARPQSVAHIRRATDFAAFDDGLWRLLDEPSARHKVREALIARYFPVDRNRLRALAGVQYSAEPKAVLLNDAQLPPQRDAAFRKLILQLYDYRCCACGIRVLLDQSSLTEAAHLIPFGLSYNDHPTNGIALCPNHHWAMDRHLIAPAPDTTKPAGIWKVSSRLDDRIEGQKSLLDLHGRHVIPPREDKILPAPDALEWRRQRLETPVV